jgi:peptide-methionine (S)-S-oxide reductase
MSEPVITDPLFREAVQAMDQGQAEKLQTLLEIHPRLVHEHLHDPDKGYFSDPYLLWFIAQNPIRQETMPANAVEIASIIIRAMKRERVSTLQHQLDYALALVCSGRVSREQKLQIPLIDLLVSEGADPNEADIAALTHQEMDAVNRLLHHGATMTLFNAIGTGRSEDFERLVKTANAEERQKALALAALYGRARMLSQLISLGVDVNAYNPPLFHAHSPALHQAVLSGSLDAVRVLIDAGADLRQRDKLHHGTPLGWAEYDHQTSIVNYLKEALAKRMTELLVNEGIIRKSDFERAAAVIRREIEN